MEVGWFRSGGTIPPSNEEEEEHLINFIKQKNYYRDDKAFLILSETYCKTINYDPDSQYRK